MTRLPRRTRNKAKAVLTPEQLRLLLRACPSLHVRSCFSSCSRECGIGELLALRWRNVDLLDGLLRMEETVYDGHFDEPKSRHSVRLVPLGPATVRLLTERHRCHFVDASSLVFSSRNGTILDRRTVLARQLNPPREHSGWATSTGICYDTRTPPCMTRSNTTGDGTSAPGALSQRDHAPGVPAFAGCRSKDGSGDAGNASYWTQVGPKFRFWQNDASRICWCRRSCWSGRGDLNS
jgi:hypothetical protein